MSEDIFIILRSSWPQILAIFYIIWWCRRIDLKSQDHNDRLDRHETRLTGLEKSQHDQAVQLARIEEALSSIRITVDRIYTRLDDK